jgi:hypothetical protein
MDPKFKLLIWQSVASKTAPTFALQNGQTGAKVDIPLFPKTQQTSGNRIFFESAALAVPTFGILKRVCKVMQKSKALSAFDF